ncbi:lipoprotein [Croceicoccus pelagius]|uniref:Lipoprotein n=1 Tax=Croceicoccus pelagius TaxID=1703341 RepID=A0A916YFU1_9SPHN|nr:lipoprotein [Croceicoccus pelagius]
MLISGLALTVSLATPHPACVRDVDCVADPALTRADAATPLYRGDIAAMPKPVVLLLQDAPEDSIADLDTGALDAKPEDEVGADAPDDENVIIVEGQSGAPEGDPAEQLNAATFKVSQAVDAAVVEPIAEVYDEALPKPIRQGLGNFLRNLGEPINILNSLLQLKPGKALKSLGRFAINTTLGVAGLFDIAAKDPINLEYEYNGLANTLGYYGVGSGPYLYLPFIGSTTVRDLAGRLVDLSIVPAVAGKPFNDPYFAIPVGALTSLESRIETDSQIDAIREKCGDPYAATRDLYLIQRKVEIDRLRGRVTADLGEIQERLEFNCDIEIETGVVPQDGDSFVEGQTTLLQDEDAVQVEETVEEPEIEPSPEAEPIMEEEVSDADRVGAIPQPGFAV